MKFHCNNVLDGGGWALVRRVRQGSVWHPTTDNLAGTQPAYGTYGAPTFDATFGRPYSLWVSSSTEFLFTTGLIVFYCKCCPAVMLQYSIVGDLSKWLITTWDQINNDGAAYGDNSPRKVLKSSDSTSCTLRVFSLAQPLKRFSIFPIAVDRKWRNNNGVAAEPWISL
jgi:hypothetical protein